MRICTLSAWSLAGLACACAPTPAEVEAPNEVQLLVVAAPAHDGEPIGDVELSRNTGSALIALADRISIIELRHGDETVLRFDDAVRDELVESLRGTTVGDSLSASSPPWPGSWVIVHVEGRKAPFVTAIVAGGQLRLNARDPYSLLIADQDGAVDFENVSEVGYSELLFEAVSEQIGDPRGERDPVPDPGREPLLNPFP